MNAVLALRAEAAAFVSWWLHELRDCAEALLARVAPRLARPVTVNFKRDDAYVTSAAMSEPQLLEPIEGQRSTRAVLVLESVDALIHEIVLPAAVERDLERAIDLHLERELPVARERVCVHSQVVRRDPEHHRITVRLIVVHRERVERARDRVVECGLRPVRIGIAVSPDEVIGNLLPRRARPDRLRVTPMDRRLAVIAGALAMVSGVLITGQWIYERVQVGKELDRVRALASSADSTARHVARQSTGGTALIGLMSKADALDVLTTLTSTVPTDSWAYEMDVAPSQGGGMQVKLSAFAPTATVLVDVLEKSPELEQVRLVSSASAGVGTGKDRMRVTARWAGK